MAYNHDQIFIQIDKAISTKPRISLSELARMLNLAIRTIRRVIWESKGESFREYQKEKVLERTQFLLANEIALLEKQIAAKIGYCSPDAFSRFIKKSTGKTLRQHRLKIP